MANLVEQNVHIAPQNRACPGAVVSWWRELFSLGDRIFFMVLLRRGEGLFRRPILRCGLKPVPQNNAPARWRGNQAPRTITRRA